MEKPNYYAIIPAEIRYDSGLSDKAKLLYGEITALTEKTGECWASNQYFADLYQVTKVTISRLIKSLVERGYVASKIEYRDNGEVERRVLTITSIPPYQKCIYPPIKNVKENNTSINNTSIKKEITKERMFRAPSLDEVDAYCRERGNDVDAERFVDFYSSKGWMIGKNKMKDWKAAVRTWERNHPKQPVEHTERYEMDLSKYD